MNNKKHSYTYCMCVYICIKCTKNAINIDATVQQIEWWQWGYGSKVVCVCVRLQCGMVRCIVVRHALKVVRGTFEIQKTNPYPRAHWPTNPTKPNSNEPKDNENGKQTIQPADEWLRVKWRFYFTLANKQTMA